jgi:uncharacterized protein (DUF433 family)
MLDPLPDARTLRSVLCDNSPVNELLGFSAEQASRLTGLSLRQLRYWDETEFFTPALRADADRAPWSRVYSFRDVVGLRTLAELRHRHHIPLQQLRRVGTYLRQHFDKSWSELVFYLIGKDVFFSDAYGEAIERADRTRQQLMPVELVKVENQVRRDVAKMRERRPEQVGKVMQRRNVAENRQVLDGTRVPTEAIWEYHQAGRSNEDIRRAYPQLRPADIEAALEFESERARGLRFA